MEKRISSRLILFDVGVCAAITLVGHVVLGLELVPTFVMITVFALVLRLASLIEKQLF